MDQEQITIDVDPKPQDNNRNVSVFESADYTIEIVHQMTLGDILTSTLLSMLIIVVLLSRLLGGKQ